MANVKKILKEYANALSGKNARQSIKDYKVSNKAFKAQRNYVRTLRNSQWRTGTELQSAGLNSNHAKRMFLIDNDSKRHAKNSLKKTEALYEDIFGKNFRNEPIAIDSIAENNQAIAKAKDKAKSAAQDMLAAKKRLTKAKAVDKALENKEKNMTDILESITKDSESKAKTMFKENAKTVGARAGTAGAGIVGINALRKKKKDQEKTASVKTTIGKTIGSTAKSVAGAGAVAGVGLGAANAMKNVTTKSPMPSREEWRDLAAKWKAKDAEDEIKHKAMVEANKLRSREMRKAATKARNEAKKKGLTPEPRKEYPMDRFNKMPTTRMVDGQKVRWPKKERWAQFLKEEDERMKQGIIGADRMRYY